MPHLPPFVADFRLLAVDGTKPDEDTIFDLNEGYPEGNYLQLPIQRTSHLQKKLQKARRKIAISQFRMKGGGMNTIFMDTLQQYLGIVGKFFGLDPNKWELATGEQTEEFTENGYRVKRVTGMYWGTQITLFYINPYYDPRLKMEEAALEELDKAGLPRPKDFSRQTVMVTTDTVWQDLVKDQPWSPSMRRQSTAELLAAKMKFGGESASQLQLEGVHGLWEMLVNKDHHMDVNKETLEGLVEMLDEGKAPTQVNNIAAAAIWSVSVSTRQRRELAGARCIEALLVMLQRTLKAKIIGKDDKEDKGLLREEQRDDMQFKCLGALGVSMVDRQCRQHLIEEQPTLKLLLECTRELEGYRPAWQTRRRVTAAQILTNVFIRDPDVRLRAVQNGSFKNLLALLTAEGNGYMTIQRCASSILQAYVLDDPAMTEMVTQKVLGAFIQACVAAISKWLQRMEDQDEWAAFTELQMLLHTTESAMYALWGASFYAQRHDGAGCRPEDVTAISDIGKRVKLLDDKGYRYTKGGMPEVWHMDTLHLSFALASALSCFAMNPITADYLMGGHEEDSPLGPCETFGLLIEPEPASYDPDGRIRAAALTGIAYLTAHPQKAEGDDVFYGFFRKKLVASGMFGRVLVAMKTPAEHEAAATMIIENGAVCLMYLATTLQHEDLQPWMMVDVLGFLESTESAAAAEHIMVTFWILLRDPRNKEMMSTLKKRTGTKGPAANEHEEMMQDQAEVRDVGTELELKNDDNLKGSTPTQEEQEEEAMLGGGEGEGGEGDENEDYALETLVRVGFKWYPRIAAAKSFDDDSPAIKMFEFLITAIWLYLIQDNQGDIPPRRRNVSELDHPKGVHEETWWGVVLPQPEFSLEDAPSVRLALDFLSKCLHLPHKVHARMMQLGCSTLWNYSALNRFVEKRLMEQDICRTLLNVVANDQWVPGLRETCASFLAYLTDEWSNHAHLSEGVLEGFQLALVELVGSRFPREQAFALRVIGHMTFIAPLSCDVPKKYVSLRKDCFMRAGIAQALAKFLTRKLQLYSAGEEDQVVIEKSDDTEEELDAPPLEEMGVLATTAHALRVARNISVRACHQVQLAKVAVMSVLRISTFFSTKIASEGCSLEEKDVCNLANGVLQNLANHPDNRTRFYKVELRGSTAAHSMQPPPLPMQSTHGSPPRTRHGLRSEVSTPQLPSAAPTLRGSLPASPARPTTGPSWAGDSMRPSTSWSTSTMPEIRPKVKFPAVRGSTAGSSSASMDGSAAGDGAKRLSKEKKKFLKWMRSTFEDQATTQAVQRVTGRIPAELQRMMPKEDAASVPELTNLVGPAEEWQESNKHALPHLQNTLRRPLSHLWASTEEERSVEGSNRWCPVISEYQEPMTNQPLPSIADKLLLTGLPQHATRDLTEAVEKIHSVGKSKMPWEQAGSGTPELPESVVQERPSTTQRQRGRVALTMLAPRTVDPLGAVQPQEDILAEPKGEPERMALRVAVAPKRGRTVITFKTDVYEHDLRSARLAMFEHHEGARVYDGLFPDYKLPNGHSAFYYYNAGGMVDEVAVDLLNPPARPSNMEKALQNALPMGADLEKVAKPPGPEGMWLELYKPVPGRCPLPGRHTLHVKDNSKEAAKDPAAYADLEEDNILFLVATNRVMKKDTQETRTKIEKKPVKPPTPREPWTLPKSIFRARLKECESKAFFDSQNVANKQFEKDWALCIEKEKIVSMLKRENKSSYKRLDDETFMKELKKCIQRHNATMSAIFNYYAASGSGSPYFIQLNAYTSLLEDTNIPSSDSKFCKRSDCDTTFIVANYVQDKKTPLAKINEDHGLMKFEFFEVIMRIAIMKHGKDQDTNDVIEAIDMLFEKEINPNVPPIALTDKNDFIRNRLYCEEVDTIYKKHEKLLRAIYSRYRLPPRSGGVRRKTLVIEDWEKLCSDMGLVDQAFGLPDVRLAFVWCRMMVSDCVTHWEKMTTMTFIDFLEALGWVADTKFIPGALDLADHGFNNWFEWQMHVENGGDEAWNVIHRRESSVSYVAEKKRQLIVKVEGLLDIIFRRLFYDPSNPDNEFSYDACLALMKKTDKSLGP